MSNKRQWTWNHHSEGQDGVHIEGHHLVWWSENWAAPFASGGACEQTFEAFLESGPVDRAISQSDLEEPRETVLAKVN